MMQKRRAIRQKRECAEDAEGTESMFAIAAAAIAAVMAATAAVTTADGINREMRVARIGGRPCAGNRCGGSRSFDRGSHLTAAIFCDRIG